MVRAVALVVMVATSSSAFADRAGVARGMCGRGVRYRGASITLDVKDADIHDVMRLLADVGGVNIVVPNTVQAKVTMRLKRVPWDQVACTVAAVHKLTLTVNGNVVLVTK
jgi:type IV pilus assembly protein PilQ